MAMRFGLKDVRFENYSIDEGKELKDTSSYAIVRNQNKCIICGDCVRMCSEIQNVGAIDFAHRGSNVEVTTAFDMPLAETNCVNCGQCVAICPTGALVIKSNVDDVWKDIYDPNVKVVAQIAPAVRVALGDEFDLPKGTNVMGKIVGAMKRLGFDEVYDTSTAADLTVIEEANELLAKIKSGNTDMPLFTSCCPAWMKYAEDNHPELVDNISSCKSPMGMMSSVIKAKAARDNEPKKTKVVAVMPCTAKKYEIHREDQMLDGEMATDHSITTVELADMIRSAGLRFEDVLPEAVEMPFGIASGAGVIFGVTGGVTEAAIRYVVGDRNKIADIAFTGVRGFEGLKEVKIPLDEEGENILSVAIVSGLKNAENLIKALQAGEVHYDFVEVMACEGGCIAGGGQPFVIGRAKAERSEGIYEADRMSGVRMSAENPVTEALYNSLLAGDNAHHLLHYK
jgi:NADH-quinone oxidoreductase subunit G